MHSFELELKDFCFDVLGDHVDPKNILIQQNRHGDWQVVILRGLCCTKEMIWDDWKYHTKDTKFEGIPLYC